MPDKSIQKISYFIKTWLPLIITVGSLVTGYYVFKAETRHQFEMQSVQIVSLKDQVNKLAQDAVSNRRDWQQGIEGQIDNIREDNIRQDMRIKVLEKRLLNVDWLQ